MAEKIIIIDLNSKTSVIREHSYEESGAYGRGLVLDLFREFVPYGADRYSADNIIVLAPGLFAGNPAPSACRMSVATIGSRDGGIQLCNTTGNMPQKLGSLGIAAVVIKGIAGRRGTVVHIDRDGVEFSVHEELNGASVPEIVAGIKGLYGRDCAVIGSSSAGDMRLSLSTFFCTYPDGDPEYHSPRSGFGDVWGAKNLRAVAVECDDYFGRDCADPDRFRSLSRDLTQRIIKDKICGGALPSLGSITIMKILKSGKELPDLKFDTDKRTVPAASGNKLNRTCAPMCVIGCLNRHATEEGLMYRSPAQVETEAAIEKCFGVKDFALSDDVQRKATDIGIVATEFVTACKTFAISQGIEDGENHLLEWLGEIERGTLTGRVIASRTYGIGSLYSDLEMNSWMDVKASQEEGLYKLRLNNKFIAGSGQNEYEDLYSQIFVLENLGFCIFTSFALLDSPEVFDLLAEMFEARTGAAMTGEKLIGYANSCVNGEKEFLKSRWAAAQKSNIPQFTRVLYRYFGDRQEQ